MYCVWYSEWFGVVQVRGRFPLSRFAFDVYVDIPPRRRVWLVDFSPWGASTEPCLFEWSELGRLSPGPLLRVVRDLTEMSKCVWDVWGSPRADEPEPLKSGFCECSTPAGSGLLMIVVRLTAG